MEDGWKRREETHSRIKSRIKQITHLVQAGTPYQSLGLYLQLKVPSHNFIFTHEQIIHIPSVPAIKVRGVNQRFPLMCGGWVGQRRDEDSERHSICAQLQGAFREAHHTSLSCQNATEEESGRGKDRDRASQ